MFEGSGSFLKLYELPYLVATYNSNYSVSDCFVFFVADRDGAIPGQSHMARGGMAG